ncbi:hypothetical protein [Cellulomonas xiejunii]|uniref:hypothetical protein n=1 Tax=Cellulomonas xiejunii TaxID=2968083 RepID=UPI001D0DFBD0|nr:hypothetical protein [Cellulomonas xiejunii]MCC2313556.1 hypothetical protein [Cellulomonas xiejunii]
MPSRITLTVGEPVLVGDGVAIVTTVHPGGVTVKNTSGDSRLLEWPHLSSLRIPGPTGVGAVERPLHPLLECLTKNSREVLFDRLEVVSTVLTGFRRGHAELAEPGEPAEPFGPTWGVGIRKRCDRMAEVIEAERRSDRRLLRRVAAGESRVTLSGSTVYSWVVRWRQDGLAGLIDGRNLRGRIPYDVVLPSEFRSAADHAVAQLDGSRSTVSFDELMRRIRIRLVAADFRGPVPERASREYLSQLMRERGRTTRSQRTRSLRGTTGYTHVPVVRIGEVVAIDATRADVLVYDERSGKPISVEILTAIDVASRVVLALRVVARSADSVDASLLMYDVMRPMSQLVEGTTYRDWRWAGIPEGIAPPFTSAVWNRLEDATLQGDIRSQVWRRTRSGPTSSAYGSAHRGAVFLLVEDRQRHRRGRGAAGPP